MDFGEKAPDGRGPFNLFYYFNKKIIIPVFRVLLKFTCGGARGVMGIVVGNGHGDTSSNSGRDWSHFT